MNTAPVADAAPDNWVDRFAPVRVRPYLRLMRADRPIGVWLLLLPCWWGLSLGAATAEASLVKLGGYAVLFAVGAIVMRGAGCAYNDIIDREIDAKVARTASRPIPAGHISIGGAWIFLIALALTGLVVLLQFNPLTIVIGIASLALVAGYPFMKRITWWPQAWLGLTFNWGALMGYSAVAGALSPAALALYGAGVAWTLGYDTIYAHQDKDDDALIGVRSSARLLGVNTKKALAVFYSASMTLLATAGVAAGLAHHYFVLIALPAAHFAWQVMRVDIDDPQRCLAIFRSNRDAGFLILAPLLLAAIPLS